MAASPVQVVACSFVYGVAAKGKTKVESETKDDKYLLDQSAERSMTPSYTPNSGTSMWPPVSRPEAQTDIDLTSG